MTQIAQHPRPLWRKNSTGETAKAAALAGEKRTLRQRVLDLIEAADAPMIPEELLERLRADGVQTVLTSVRPRCSELARLGLITDSGERRKGEGGCKAIAWKATTAGERAAWAAAKAAEGDA